MNKNEEEINKLAATLKARGIASSMTEAIEKARSIMQGIDMPTPPGMKTCCARRECSSCGPAPSRIEPEPVKAVEVEESKKENIETESEDEIEDAEDIDPRIEQIDSEISVLEAKNDLRQRKINTQDDDYDIMGDDRTLNEILGEAKEEAQEEKSNESEKESDEMSEEDEQSMPIEKEIGEIEEIDTGDLGREEHAEQEDFIVHEDESESQEEEKEEPEKEQERPKLTEEEKKMSDLSRIFNFAKMKKK